MTRRFLGLALVNILTNLTVPAAGLVDAAMLGHLPEIRHLAGVALGSVLFDYVYWTFGFLRMGTTGTTAQAVGRADPAEVHRVLYRSLAWAFAIAAALLVLRGPIREAGFALLSGTTDVEDAGRRYFDARILGAPAALANFALVGWFLGRERARAVLLMTAAANASNIAFNYWLIVVLGLASLGAGLATMASQYLMLAIGGWLFFREARPEPLRLGVVFDRERMLDAFRLNRDILLRTLCLISTFAAFTNLSAGFGVAILAANAILLRLLSVAAYLIDGVAFAVESLVGVYRGAGDQAALRRLLRLSLVVSTAFAAAFLLVLFAAPRTILALLTSHADVRELALNHLPWLLLVFGFGSAAYMFDGLFLGLTQGRALRNSMALSTLAVFAPLAFWAVARESNHLLWLALGLFNAARALTLGLAARTWLYAESRNR